MRYLSSAQPSLPRLASDVAGVALPLGAVVRDAFWVSDRQVPDVAALVRALVVRYPDTGLWPLVLQQRVPHRGLHGVKGGVDPADVDAIDPAAVLARWWHEQFDYDHRDVPPDEREELEEELLQSAAPFGAEFPGLAPPSDVAFSGDAVAQALTDEPGRLALVPVRRAADAVAVLGPPRGGEYWDRDVRHLPAVVLSWQQRFEAVPLVMDFDRLIMAVERPPATLTAAQAVAAEHYAVCRELWDPIGPLGAYAVEHLLNALVWGFWWD